MSVTMQAATPSTSTAPSAGSASMTSLLLYTHNVARALKPSTDGELAHAIHETLHYALDGDEADWAAGDDLRASATPCGPDQGATAASGSEAAEPGSVRPGFFATGDDERPFISYAWNAKKRQLTLPNPVTVVNPTLMDPCAPDCNTRDSFDVTAKFFFLGEEDDDIGDDGNDFGPRTEWIEEALEKFTLATGLATVDTLIVAFPGKDLDGVDRRRRRPEHATSANGNGVDDRRQKLQRDVSAIAKVWQQLSPNPRILSMGLSDLSLEALNLLFQSFNPAPPPAPETALLTPSRAVLATEDNGRGAAAGSSGSSTVGGSLTSVTSSMVSEAFAGQSGSSASSAFSTPKSAMSTIPIPSSPSSPSVSSNQQRTELGDGAFQAYRLPSPTRRPRIHTINLKEHGGCTDGRCIDRELAEWCKAQGILLVAHNDQRGESARTCPRREDRSLLYLPIFFASRSGKQTSCQRGHCRTSWPSSRASSHTVAASLFRRRNSRRGGASSTRSSFATAASWRTKGASSLFCFCLMPTPAHINLALFSRLSCSFILYSDVLADAHLQP